MKKFLLVSAVFCSTLVANAALSSDDYSINDYIGEWGRLKLVGNQLSAENGSSVQLKGWTTTPINDELNAPCLSEDAFLAMKTWGANVVRLPINPPTEDDTLTIMDYDAIKTYIDFATKNKMYVIVDWHVHSLLGNQCAESGNPALYEREAKKFFSEIARWTTETNKKNVLYEICDKPCGVTMEEINAYADTVLPVIEKESPGAVVIVGTPEWNHNIGNAVLSPIAKNQYNLDIMYAFHFHACNHSSLIFRMIDASASIPVFVSEWSATSVDGSEIFCPEEADKFTSYMEPYGNSGGQLISWCFGTWSATDGVSSCLNTCPTKFEKSQLSQLGKYAMNLLTESNLCFFCVQDDPYDLINIPSSKDKWGEWGVLNIGYFDHGGQNISYFDYNSSMYVKENGKYNYDKIDTTGIEYKVANAGAYISDFQKLGQYDEFYRYDEDVDVTNSCAGLDGAYGEMGDGFTRDLHYLTMTEPGEWIKYTINVNKVGYYKVNVLTSTTTTKGSIGLSITKKNGEKESILRNYSKRYNERDCVIADMSLDKCVPGAWPDGTIQPQDKNWKDDRNAKGNEYLCWGWIEPGGETKKDLCVLFKNKGEQKLYLNIAFNDTISPGEFSNLLFTYIEGQGEIPSFEYELSDVANVEQSNDVDIYPNPSTGSFNIKLASSANVQVFNTIGAIVYSNDVEGNVGITGLAAGVYTVRISTATGVTTHKVVVK